MSKILKKGYNLPRLQKEIVIELAKNGPSTMNEISEKLGKQYRAVWNAFQKLKEKGFIKRVGRKEYRGQEFSTYWFTELGTIVAIANGAPSSLLKIAEKIYPNQAQTYKLIQDWASSLPEATFRQMVVMYIRFKEKGELPISAIPLNKKMIPRFFKPLRKYPKFKRQVKEMLDFMQKLLLEEE